MLAREGGVVGIDDRADPGQRRALGADHPVREDLPYPLRSIQVDGGSEFRAGFEDACQTLQLPLAALPPKSPQLNSVVERANDRSRTEFWNLYPGSFTVREASPALAQYQHFYNHVRPHYALDLMTPMEYLTQYRSAEPQQVPYVMNRHMNLNFWTVKYIIPYEFKHI